MSNTSDQTTQPSKTRLIIDEIGVDTETGIIGRGHSHDNGKTFTVDKTIYGRIFHKSDHDQVWKGIQDKVKTVVEPAKSAANSAVAYANDAVEKSKVNSQAIDDINSAVSDAVSDAAVARSDGLRAWNAAQSNVNLIDLNYASASAAISSARTEALAAADEAKTSASAAQADIVVVKSSVAAVQADVTATKSDVAVAKSDIADTKTSLDSQANSLSSYAAQASANGADIVTLKSQAGQLEQDMADTKGDVSQLKVSASSASVALSDAAGNISSLQATATSYSAALSDTNSNVASVTATASELETKYADAAGDISQIKTDAKGMTQTISNAQGDIANLKTRADGFDTEFATANGNISKLQTDATGTTQILTNAKSDIAVLQSRADGFDAKYATAAGDINTLKTNASGFSQTLTNAQGDISTLKSTVSGVQTTLTDAQGNISTLQSDVSGLKKTTSDNAGNIATLQATANTLTSQMSSAQGDISTLKQTASDFSSKVSGMQTSLSNANNGLDNLKNQAQWVTVTDTVDLNNIKTPCHEFLKGAVTNAPNEVAWWYLTVEGSEGNRITQTVIADQSNNRYTRRFADSWSAWVRDATQTDVTALSNLITTNTTAINQNKTAIALKADQTTVDKTNGTVQQLQSQLQVQAGQIATKVSSSDLDAKGYATQTYTQSLVTQKANDWNLNLTNLKTDVNAIKANGGGVNLVSGTNQEYVMGYGIPNTTWQDGYAYLKLPLNTTVGEILPQSPHTFFYTLTKGTSYTQTIWFETDAKLTNSSGIQFTWFTGAGHDLQPAMLVNLGENKYKIYSTYMWPGKSNNSLRLFDIEQLGSTFDLTTGTYLKFGKLMLEEGTISHTWSPAPSDMATVTSVTNLSATVDGIKSTVATKVDQSTVTQLSNLVQTKVSSGDFTSTTTQLKNLINQRVQVGDVISQINQEAGGNTLIQVSNGKGSLILNADNTIFTGKAWLPVAAIADLTSDQIQAGTLSGSKVHAGDNSGNAIDMGALSTDYVGFHAYANNGDNTYIDLNGIHNYGASYDTRIQQGKITTNYLTVNGGGMIDFRDSNGTGMVAQGSTLTFDIGNTPAGYLSYNGMPVAEIPDGSGGNELAIRYGLSAAIIPNDNSGAQATFSGAAQKIGYMTGTNQGKQMLSGLEVHSNNHHWFGTVNSDATWNRIEINSNDGVNLAWHDQTHFWISDGKAKLYKDNNDSQTATELEVHGWAWVNGWVEAAGHSQHSTLSSKTRIEEADPDYMLDLVNNTDLTTFAFKSEVAEGLVVRHIGPIIDDVNDVAQYRTPAEFIAPTKTARDDDNMIGALFGAVQALTKRIKKLEDKLNG
ncbi:hypothetical protein HCZ82_04695 [Limosilactobacillus fermentum]